MQVALGPVRGKFKFKIALEPQPDETHLRMKISGGGLGSVVDLLAGAKLRANADATTTLDWNGKASMRGPVATVDGRVIDAQAERVIRTTFGNVKARLVALMKLACSRSSAAMRSKKGIACRRQALGSIRNRQPVLLQIRPEAPPAPEAMRGRSLTSDTAGGARATVERGAEAGGDAVAEGSAGDDLEVAEWGAAGGDRPASITERVIVPMSCSSEGAVDGYIERRVPLRRLVVVGFTPSVKRCDDCCDT